MLILLLDFIMADGNATGSDEQSARLLGGETLIALGVIGRLCPKD